jgi:hypothetical protein
MSALARIAERAPPIQPSSDLSSSADSSSADQAKSRAKRALFGAG